MIAVRDEAECRAKLREIEAAGGPSGRQVIFIRTNVPRKDWADESPGGRS
jgi:hypothetical protein